METVILPKQAAYIGAFLTFRCTFGCSYCINRHNKLNPRKELSPKDWIEGLNRFILRRENEIPITLQGGEPSRHDGFIDIIKGLHPSFYIDILTNLDFDIDRFMRDIPPERLQRDVPYGSIRVSYHPEISNLDILLDKITKMQNNGYSIGLFTVAHPDTDIELVRKKAEKRCVDFRTKEFLGVYKNKLYGNYKYPEAVNGKDLKKVQCRTTEIVVAPDGSIHKCHRDLYHGEYPLANILDKDLSISFPYRNCNRYGQCSPCDIKIKNNRFQEFGHTSVEIKNIENVEVALSLPHYV